MSTYVANLLAQAEQIKAERAARWATETLAEAQAALDEAQARYDAYPCSSNAYAIAEANDRVEAAKPRGNKLAVRQSCQEYSIVSMTEQGYRFGAPSPGAEAIDAEIAESVTCRRCGGQCRYEAWHKAGSYVALVVCNSCGNTDEF